METGGRLAQTALLGVAALLLVGGAAAAPATVDQDKVLDDLLFDLQLVPLDGQVPAAFSLERVGDGRKVTLAEHHGRPMLLYFWASW